jgi:hypothetical protein
MLAFGSADEAKLRFEHFLEEICRWEESAVPKPCLMEPGVDAAEVGRFQLSRRGNQVRMDVAVDGRKYRELLYVWGDHDAWNWGGG